MSTTAFLQPAAEQEILRLRNQVAELQAQLQQQNSSGAQSEYLAAVVEGSNDAIISKTLNGIVTTWNRAAETMFGYTADEMIGQSILRLIPPDRSTDFQDILRRIRQGERVEHYETFRRCKDGTLIEVSLTVSPIYNHAGEVVGASKIARSIGEKKRIEAALLESEEQLRATFEQAAVGLAHVALNGQWLRVNQRLCDIVGYTGDELLQLSFGDITYAEDLDADWAQANALLRGDISTYTMEKRYLHKDGRLVWINLTVSLLRDQAGRPQRFISVIEDITARKTAEQKLLELNETLEQRVETRTRALAELNRELEAFSYSVSHDLRAPLRSIDGFGQRLLDRYNGRMLDEIAIDYLQRMTRASQRMGQLIEDLLNLSRLSRTEMVCRPVDLSALAESILAELRSREPQRPVTVQIEPGLTAEGDPRLVSIALDNLLANAWKYTAKKQEATIAFGSVCRDGEQVYFVRDNGAGFDMAYAGQLFVPFQRLHRAGEFEGSGIGLATAQRIFHRHGGRIWAEASKDRGATFFFTLPIQEGEQNESRSQAGAAGRR